MSRPHAQDAQDLLRLLGAGFALALAGGGMLAVDWLQVPGIILLLVGILLLIAAQAHWWIFG